jgi:archaellum component FlaC
MANQLSLGNSSVVLNTSAESLTDSNSTDDSQKRHRSKRGRHGNSPNTSSAVTNTEPKKKRRTMDDLFMKMENGFDNIIDKLGSMDKRVKLVENSLISLQSTSQSIGEKITSMKSEIDANISSHENQITVLQDDIRNLNETICKIISDKDNVYFEVNKLNLIISGLPDSSSETSEQLSAKLKPFLHKITSKHLNVDCSFRLGAFSDKYPRRIKIRFNTLSDRNTVWSLRDMAQPPYYINEDLSPNIRQIHGKLRQQKRDILSKNPSAKLWIDWKQLTINPGERPSTSITRSRPSSYNHGAGTPMDTEANPHGRLSKPTTSSFLGYPHQM